jgi:hypothetical protein
MTAHIALSLDDSLRAALARAEQAEAERDGLREVLEDIAMALIDGTPVKNGVIFPVGGEAAKLLAAVDEAHRILLAALKPYTEPSHG